MSAAILDFGPNPEKTLRYKLAQFRRDMQQQAEATARAKREADLMRGYADRHPDTSGPERAA